MGIGPAAWSAEAHYESVRSDVAGFFAVVIAVMVIINMDSIIRYIKMRQL